MASTAPRFSDSVFINCPFDREYWPLFEALVFCVLDCGFVPRCSLEAPDSGEARVRRIQYIIGNSLYSIHDISRVQLTPNFPRFNMPFEVGLDLGCRNYGSNQARRKRCLILDSEPYRYHEFFSDIAGQDIRPHHDSPDEVIVIVRDWLRATSRRTALPGPITIKKHFAEFSKELPAYCDRIGLDRHDIQFVEYVSLVEEWLRALPP